MMRPVMYATLRVIESQRKLNPRHERYKPVATKAIPIAIDKNSGSDATTTPTPAAGKPPTRRQSPEYQRSICCRELIRASRFAATSARRENGRRSSPRNYVLAAESVQPPPVGVPQLTH